MIQRRQTLFLIISIVVTIICLCLPLGIFRPHGMGFDATMYNLWISNGDATVDMKSCPLLAVMLVAELICVFTIFAYNNRKLQIKLCTALIFIYIIWYILYAIFVAMGVSGRDYSFKPEFAAILPLVNVVLVFMARNGVKADEALIKAADRIR